MIDKNPPIKYTKLFINNEFVDAKSGKTFSITNPTTGQKIVDVAEAQTEDVDIAVAAANDAFAKGSTWRKMNGYSRGKLLYKLADLMERDLSYLCSLETLDGGKLYKESVGDITSSIEAIRYYAGWSDKISGKTIPLDENLFSMTRLEPVGVVGQILPWNHPSLMLSWKWGCALACGCTLVLKPSEQTPLTALALAALSKEAGFPPGVINVLTGYGKIIGDTIVRHPKINKIAFTGSTEVGHRIISNCSLTFKRAGLELGGKSPLVVFDDYDVDEAVNIAYAAAFGNMGQNCTAASRIYVQANIYEKFVLKTTEKAAKIKIGDPFDPDVEHGPQTDKGTFKKILRLIESAKQEGAVCTTGGQRFGNVGYFIKPTVFRDVTDDMEIAKEEIFGPVLLLLKFDNMEEVIDRSNDTIYGLASACITNDLNKAFTYANEVEAGVVWVNCYNQIRPSAPFGGYKHSGIGKELGEESIHEYMHIKQVTINLHTV